MNARALAIDGKLKQHPTSYASLHDFRYHEGRAVDPSEVLESPDLSLYCLDPQQRQAIFVRTSGTDLSDAPFYYDAQYQAATELVAVPYETLHSLAAAVPLRTDKLVLIYSTGRCGSTLVSRALAAVRGVVSLCEPDVFTQIVALQSMRGYDQEELRRLTRTCTKLLYLTAARADRSAVCALKFRGSAIGLSGELQELAPDAKIVFLYRNALTWVQSCARAFRLLDPTSSAQWPELRRIVCHLLVGVSNDAIPCETEMPPLDLLLCAWIAAIRYCMLLQQRGLQVFVARYEDLKHSSHAVLNALFEHCGVTAAAQRDLEQLLASDAQAGTYLARDVLETAAGAVAEISALAVRELIRKYSPDLTPEYTIPNTFRPSRASSRG